MQDMLDLDIRSEVATVVGGSNEFSTLMNFDLPSLDLDTNSNDCDISWFSGGPKWSGQNDIYADVGACVNPNSVMPVITSSAASGSSVTPSVSSSSANGGGGGTTLSLLNSTKDFLLQSPKERKSHLTFSPNTIKVPVVQENKLKTSFIQPQRLNNIELVKKDLILELKDDKMLKQTIGGGNGLNGSNVNIQHHNTHSHQTNNITTSVNVTNNNSNHISVPSGGSTLKLAAGIGGLTFANNIAYNKLKHNNMKTLQNSNRHAISILNKHERESSPHQQQHHQQVQQQNHHQFNNNNFNSSSTATTSSSSPSTSTSSSTNNAPTAYQQQNLQKIFKNGLLNNKQVYSSNNSSSHHHNHTNLQLGLNNHHHQNHHNSNSNNNNNATKLISKLTGQEFPKPAYSYSCLIAMALKNSRAGSLPVSEIYSFMCEHFPYFKTAPNGWKNSVRHNLSLNKCFEKIEKPATNGGQRKGCLWAMNPTKITKMDEEVQKWSRKDPMAIRKAMVYPENLELLERGEMKHGSTGDSEGEGEGEIENEIEGHTTDDAEQSDSEHEQEQDLEERIIPAIIESCEDDEQDVEFDVEVN